MLGECLQEIRKDHGDTQQSLVDKLNVTLYAVRCWKQRKNSPSYKSLIRICRLYHVSSDYLLGLTNEDLRYAPPQRKVLNEENLLTLRKFTAFPLSEQNKKQKNK